MRLILLYVVGSTVAVSTTMFLVLVGLELTGYQWSLVILIVPVVVPFFIFVDIYLIIRHFRPVRAILERFDGGETPTPEEVSSAVCRALNLPFYSFIRVTFIHGPLASGDGEVGVDGLERGGDFAVTPDPVIVVAGNQPKGHGDADPDLGVAGQAVQAVEEGNERVLPALAALVARNRRAVGQGRGAFVVIDIDKEILAAEHQLGAAQPGHAGGVVVDRADVGGGRRSARERRAGAADAFLAGCEGGCRHRIRRGHRQGGNRCRQRPVRAFSAHAESHQPAPPPGHP